MLMELLAHGREQLQAPTLEAVGCVLRAIDVTSPEFELDAQQWFAVLEHYLTTGLWREAIDALACAASQSSLSFSHLDTSTAPPVPPVENRSPFQNMPCDGTRRTAFALNMVLTSGEAAPTESPISPRFFSKFFSSTNQETYDDFLMSERSLGTEWRNVSSGDDGEHEHEGTLSDFDSGEQTSDKSHSVELAFSTAGGGPGEGHPFGGFSPRRRDSMAMPGLPISGLSALSGLSNLAGWERFGTGEAAMGAEPAVLDELLGEIEREADARTLSPSSAAASSPTLSISTPTPAHLPGTASSSIAAFASLSPVRPPHSSSSASGRRPSLSSSLPLTPSSPSYLAHTPSTPAHASEDASDGGSGATLAAEVERAVAAWDRFYNDNEDESGQDLRLEIFSAASSLIVVVTEDYETTHQHCVSTIRGDESKRILASKWITPNKLTKVWRTPADLLDTQTEGNILQNNASFAKDRQRHATLYHQHQATYCESKWELDCAIRQLNASEGGSKMEYKELQACAALLAAHYNLVRLYQAHVRMLSILRRNQKESSEALKALEKMASKNRQVYSSVQSHIEDHSAHTPRHR
eukprot:TRINITY_DN12659_c0_g1_i1.p1 TRINITY_DN12659_c0_g1~~TRINITY_DN12659_c0_g1_i1.p1  ORF type:complete len:608 (-),score=247.36 TRINITY_DN12659_c0_g1_i1:163-1905(-)